MKKRAEKFAGFEIVWMSVSRVGETNSQSRKSNFPFGDDRNNVIVFIDGRGRSRKESNRVEVHVLSPRSEEWGSRLADSKVFLDELRDCVRVVLKDSDEKLDIEVKNMTYTWAEA